MGTSVFGIYPNQEAVEDAVDRLQAGGFRSTDIALLLPRNLGNKDFGHEKTTKVTAAAAAGATIGATIGAAFGWAAGNGLVAVAALEPYLVAGPIVSALAGAGAGGVLGVLPGALAGLGQPEYKARRYEGRVRRGGILLSVHVDDGDWRKRARRILKDTGAQDIAAIKEAGGDFGATERPVPRRTAATELLVEPRTSRAELALAPANALSEETAELADAPSLDRAATVRQAMSADLEIVDASERCVELQERFRERPRGLILVREDDRVTGVLPERDWTVESYAEDTTVGAIATQDYLTVFENQTLAEAAALLEENRAYRLLVLDSDRRPAGVLSAPRLAKVLREPEIANRALASS